MPTDPTTRTAIFVYEPTTLTIETSEPNLVLVPYDARFGDRPLKAANTIEVPAGVYKILSSSDVKVTGSKTIDVHASPNSKDGTPPLPPKLRGMNTAAVSDFLATPLKSWDD